MRLIGKDVFNLSGTDEEITRADSVAETNTTAFNGKWLVAEHYFEGKTKSKKEAEKRKCLRLDERGIGVGPEY